MGASVREGSHAGFTQSESTEKKKKNRSAPSDDIEPLKTGKAATLNRYLKS
jgi:hypothetical protein